MVPITTVGKFILAPGHTIQFYNANNNIILIVTCNNCLKQAVKEDALSAPGRKL